MANTGYKIITYLDTNKFSSTYGQTRTEKVIDYDTCPSELANWVEESRSCNYITYQPSGQQGFDGRATVTEKDANPNSPTYNQTRERTVTDLTNCPLPSTTAVWEVQSETCEQV